MSFEIILSFVGVFIALGGIIYTFSVSRRVDKQQIEINNSIISDNKKADFKTYIEREQRYSSFGKLQNINKLVIENIGKQAAMNFSVEFPENENEAFMLKEIYEKIFHPAQKNEYHIAIYIGCPKKLNLKFKWDDDFEKNREKEYVLII